MPVLFSIKPLAWVIYCLPAKYSLKGLQRAGKKLTTTGLGHFAKLMQQPERHVLVKKVGNLKILPLSYNFLHSAVYCLWNCCSRVININKLLRMLATMEKILFFFNWNSLSMQGWTHTMRHGVTRKRRTKKLKHTRNFFRKSLQLKDVC